MTTSHLTSDWKIKVKCQDSSQQRASELPSATRVTKLTEEEDIQVSTVYANVNNAATILKAFSFVEQEKIMQV